MLQRSNKRFIKTTIIASFVTLVVAYYISYLLFYGDNSYEVYKDLKNRKVRLKKDIKSLQIQNANLQKQYFELKNLEPEEI